ncbi:helix-turn-helix domain-containing protein [Peribacillus butanolivorans]|uniref:helix-turn-helix domain-containing protein n=1 Tax=Peribacillus butanolivorans TaxID=421767 RepID=UPI0035DC877D
MNKSEKRTKLVEKIETHLRLTARNLVKFDTIQETLDFTVESFQLEFSWDFVAIVLREDDILYPKVWKGGSPHFADSFPIHLSECSPEILEEGWDIRKEESSINCKFYKLMKNERISTWFTVPLKDDGISYGFCIIGFHNFVPLISEVEQIFVEFGKDVAVAMQLAKEKEFEKRKLSSIRWVNENVTPGSSMEELVQKVLELSCQGTMAEDASIYLFDESENCFYLQSPLIGSPKLEENIRVIGENELSTYFPFFEKSGGFQLSVPLVVNLKTVGMIHLANKAMGAFTVGDLELLKFLSNHVAALFENARLYLNEIHLKQRLQKIMGYQQKLVKETLYGEDFDVITDTLSGLLSCSIILFDRFFRYISIHLENEDEYSLPDIYSFIEKEKAKIGKEKRGIWLGDFKKDSTAIGFWPVIGSGELLGYLAIITNKNAVDEVTNLTIGHALNVYAIQFIKQKLIIETKEQVKDSYITKLFEEKIEDKAKIVEYATLMNIDLYRPHRIAALKLEEESLLSHSNLIEREAEKASEWDHMKEQLYLKYKEIIVTKRDDMMILMIPVEREKDLASSYWGELYQYLREQPIFKKLSLTIYMGVGGATDKLEDYYYAYKQAMHAYNVSRNGFPKNGLAIFDELGSYSLLNNLKDPALADLFLKKYLAPLMEYSKGSGADLMNTLRAYLFNNGNLKNTMDVLFIHRSTLRYRLERIRDILDMDLEDAETRLNLMIAYKLHDLYQSSQL